MDLCMGPWHSHSIPMLTITLHVLMWSGSSESPFLIVDDEAALLIVPESRRPLCCFSSNVDDEVARLICSESTCVSVTGPVWDLRDVRSY